MPPNKPVKIAGRPLIVGVITTRDELRAAARLPQPPDLFELRLDCLVKESKIESGARRLRAPLIITARHPAEGGRNMLSDDLRRELLLRFLPIARLVDVELRSARPFGTVLEQARRLGLGTIISFHDLKTTPSLGSLHAKARRAAQLKPDLFKAATRTDTRIQLTILLRFLASPSPNLPMAIMGLGRLGPISRLLFAECGSALIYAAIGRPQVEGQLNLQQVRSWMGLSDRSV
jgi:3-dehydroquinate dehydratase-1